MISIIVAMGKNRVIGNGGKIPWDLPADLEYFRKVTLGHAVIMGRKTHESIGRALPGRMNIVITRQKSYLPKGDGVLVSGSLVDAIRIMKENRLGNFSDIFVIGGAEIYKEALLVADQLRITFIDGDFPGDVFFPEFDMKEWREIYREKRLSDRNNPHSLEWVVFERKEKS